MRTGRWSRASTHLQWRISVRGAVTIVGIVVVIVVTTSLIVIVIVICPTQA